MAEDRAGLPWPEMEAKLFADLDVWRQAHPRATVADTEAAVEERLGLLRAELIAQELALRAAAEAAEFDAAGYPVGSGMVESANKLVVEARLKGSGMHWARANVNPLLALRSAICSGRWPEVWPRIWQGLCEKRHERRQLPRPPTTTAPPPPHRPALLAMRLPALKRVPKCFIQNGRPTK